MSSLKHLFSAVFAVVFLAACSPAAPVPTAAPAAAKPPGVTPPPAAAASPAASPAAAAAASAVSAASPAPAAKPAAAPSPSPVAAAAPAGPPASGDITVFAAASLTDVFNAMAMAFQQANPQAHVTFNFASSGTLTTQLGQGAKADAYASADQNTMNNARTAGAVTGPDQIFARNSLIVITPKANPARISTLKDLANPGLKIVTADTTVPIGNYTQTMLIKASADPTYGPDFQAKFTANVVSQQTDDRQIVAQVQLGEADAGVVYATDITPTTRDQLNSFPVPDAFNTVVVYPIATARGDNPAGGQAYVNFVLSPAGQVVLATWNFLPATASAAAAAAPVPAVASATFSPEVAIKGLVGTPRSFTFDDLTRLPAESVQVSFQAGQGTTTASFTGTRLLNVFDAAGGAKLPNDSNNAKLRATVMVTGADGYQVALAWGELDPDYGAAPILLAYTQDGQPMGDKQGMARLVVPGDKRGGRYVATVKSVELRDPGPAQP